MHGLLLTEWQNVFDATARQPALKQTRCWLGKDDLLVKCYVIAVRVRNESEALCVPGIQPKILFRQVNASFVTNFNHQQEIYFQIRVSKMCSSITFVRCTGLMLCALTPDSKPASISRMRFTVAACILMFFALGFSSDGAREEPRVVEKLTPLPVVLDKDFEFRKTKLFLLSEKAKTSQARQTTSAINKKSGDSPGQKTATLQDAPITFERQYRMFGAVTGLDQRQRFGNYFDFFWRAKRPSDVTVRLEYRQEKLHEHVQGQEITYRNVQGTHKTEFKVIGDDYFDDGQVIAWRCLLISNGRIVAENRSFMWE
jgi:hypothetical protein